MTTIDSIAGAAGTSTAATTATASSALGKDDFLKLFVSQLQHQDPMSPMEDAEFMSQMTAFSTLEQVTNLASSMSGLAESQTQSSALQLLGKTVTYTTEDGVAQTGPVEKVVNAGGKATLTVAGVAGVDPSTVVEIG